MSSRSGEPLTKSEFQHRKEEYADGIAELAAKNLAQNPVVMFGDSSASAEVPFLFRISYRGSEYVPVVIHIPVGRHGASAIKEVVKQGLERAWPNIVEAGAEKPSVRPISHKSQ